MRGSKITIETIKADAFTAVDHLPKCKDLKSFTKVADALRLAGRHARKLGLACVRRDKKIAKLEATLKALQAHAK